MDVLCCEPSLHFTQPLQRLLPCHHDVRCSWMAADEQTCEPGSRALDLRMGLACTR